GDVKWRLSFTAKQYEGNTFSGQLQFTDHAGLKFQGTVIDLKVVDNKAKICYTYTSGPWAGQFGCVVVADNGEGSNATGPDMMSGFLWTDGTDIGTATIPELTAMSPDEFISWIEDYVFPVLYGIPIPGPVLVPTSHGNIQVR
ncbi:MAG: hypothetical protein OEM41_09760, partial [Ignavibacteria bacterium]|nr:hypothetical protein [Ignavibacteria bacterium]